MRRSELLVGLLLAAAVPSSAQNFPKVEASAGYMYLRFNPSVGASANCNGGYGSVGVNFNAWFGVVGNIDACKTNRPAPATNGTATTYLFGRHWNATASSCDYPTDDRTSADLLLRNLEDRRSIRDEGELGKAEFNS